MAAASRKNQFKVVLLGEGCVGKTSLMLRYVQDKFNDKHLTTLQVRYLSLMVAIIVSTTLHDRSNLFVKHLKRKLVPVVSFRGQLYKLSKACT